MPATAFDADALISMFENASAKGSAQLQKAVTEATLAALQGRELTLANIRAGVRHLKALGQEFRHPVLVAAAYHAGAEAVRSARGIPKGPRTAEYVVAVLNGFYDLMAIAGPEAARPAAARPALARNSAATASARNSTRTARADASTPTNPTGIWERGFVLHLD